MRSVYIVAGIAALVLACRAAETPDQAEARMAAEAGVATAALDSVYERMKGFVATENADSLAALYAEDARMYPQDEPIVVGRDAIRAKYIEWFGMGTADIRSERLGILVNGPVAVERMTWTMTITAEPGGPPMEPMTMIGKGVVVWRKIGDQWLIVDDIGNNDAPMAAPGSGS
jgi:ketosteroid isomerase-like protein